MKFRLVFISVFFLAVTSLVGSYLFFNSWSEQNNAGNKLEEAAQQRYTVSKYTVEKDDTWETITKKFAIDWNLGASLLEGAKDIYNLAALREGNELRFIYDPAAHELIGTEYDIDDEKMLTLEKSQNSNLQTVTGGVEMFEARLENIEYEIVPVLKQGSIESSLFETAQKEDIPASVIMEMARIFSWDVDFASSVQPGDSFKIVYEERFRGGKKGKPGKILTGEFINKGRKVYAFYFEPSEDSPLSRKDSEDAQSGSASASFSGQIGKGEYYNEEGRELRRQFLRSPLDYKRITSSFSYNRFHPILQTFTTHRAIDYAASTGTSVSVTADGVVNYAGVKGGNGKFVGIRHENGYETGYAHLSAYAKGIKVGVRVEQNQIIGFVGSTGWSTGPHLHYEMRKNGVFINPLRLDLPPGKMMQEEYREEFLQKKDELLRLLVEL